jgi:hypothetical protein
MHGASLGPKIRESALHPRPPSTILSPGGFLGLKEALCIYVIFPKGRLPKPILRKRERERAIFRATIKFAQKKLSGVQYAETCAMRLRRLKMRKDLY